MIFEMYDFEHSNAEERYIAIGKVGDVLFLQDQLPIWKGGLYYGQDFYN